MKKFRSNWFRVAVEGETVGHVENATGLFLFHPLDDRDTVERVFYPREAYREVQLGESIGQVLVDSQAVTKEQVERAAAEQENLRNRKLGDYLVIKEIVQPEQLLQALYHAPFATLAIAYGKNFGAGADLFVAASVRVAGGVPVLLGPAADDLTAIRDAVRPHLDAHVVGRLAQHGGAREAVDGSCGRNGRPDRVARHAGRVGEKQEGPRHQRRVELADGAGGGVAVGHALSVRTAPNPAG